MKKFFVTTLALLALALPSLSLTAGCGDCCFNPCQGGPLSCGKLSVMVKGGVTPSGYTHRGPIWVTVPTLTPAVFSPVCVDKFGDQFGVPWNVGAEIAWNASCRIQFFLEYAFTGAEGKKRNLDVTVDTTTVSIHQRYSNYEVNAGYLGSRYYFEGCCFPCLGKISPYVGFKTGLAVQRRILNSVVATDGTTTVELSTPYFKHETQVSGGLQIGLEWWFCNCLSLVLQGEFVGTCGFRPNRNIETGNATVTNVNIGSTGWIIAWPVTLGLRWTF